MQRQVRTITVLSALLVIALIIGVAPRITAQAADPVINEFVFNHTGTDTNEFIEVFGTPNTDYSALTLLEIEGDSTGAGVIDGVFPLGTTNGAGFWTTGFLNQLENGTVSVLLVEGFTGSARDDLDTNNDGTLDSMPWSRIVDSVAVTDGGSSDRTYADTVLAGGFDGVSFTPGGASRIPNAVDTNAVSNWMRNDFDGAGLPGFAGSPEFGEAFNTPGAENEAVPNPELVCGNPATLINAVQGAGFASPLDGDTVIVEGVVVGDYQGSDALNGFFLQEEPADSDGNSLTSEGIFVYAPSSPDVMPGDTVRVKGRVAEFFGLTEITGVSAVLVCDVPTVVIAPTMVTLPVVSFGDAFEPLEGMLVEFPQTLYVTEHFNLGRFGEVSLSVNDRLPNPTNVALPGVDAAAVKALNDQSRILLDDARNGENREPVAYLGPDGTLRGGDTVTNLVGVMSYGFSSYRIQPVDVPFVRANPRPVTPAPVGGEVQVAAFNVLNYFNGDGMGGGFPTSRGADTPEEFARQEAKLVAALTALDADVVGLMEIENDGYGPLSAIASLVNAVNAAAGPGTYAYIAPDLPKIGTDDIAVGLIYKPAVVTPYGDPAILDSSVDSRFIDTKNRPVLIQTFVENATGARFTVAVNHLKSKGSSCDDVDDPDTGDGQGNCNRTRLAAAQALADYLATDPTGSNDPDFLIIGDLNSYAMEDPIRALEAAGYTDLLIEKFEGQGAYSYVFFGEWGYLDHALAIQNLVHQVTGTGVYHINADEPRILDYNTEFNPASLYHPDQYRASDHDPVLVGMLLDIELPLDVRPGNSVDPVNLKSNGTLPAAILSTPYFDATDLDPATIRLAGAPIAHRGKGYLVQYRDVNGDGLTDLFAHFETMFIQLAPDADTISFEAEWNGRLVYGSDDIRQVPSGMACTSGMDLSASFLWGRTVGQVMGAGNNGHPWYVLAQAALTTRQLEAQGVPLPADLVPTLTEAESRLAVIDPDGRLRGLERQLMRDLANVLEDFNAAQGCGG
ncbi:MAG: ExeM/NucH family extracellular endonuclease [Anaerolineae bacterium]